MTDPHLDDVSDIDIDEHVDSDSDDDDEKQLANMALAANPTLREQLE